MIILMYPVHSLKYKKKIILCGGIKYLSFPTQINSYFWVKKECYYASLNSALIL
ncbi:hypothetical protein CsatB_018961 [Cannabis sativa]